MSDCNAATGSNEVCMSNDSPVICRGGLCTQRTADLKPGVDYKAWSPLTWSTDKPKQVELMTSSDQPIAGVLTCGHDLTDTAVDVICPTKLLCGAIFDINMLNWPDAFTIEQLEVIMSTSDKPCFRTRIGCIQLPAWVAEQEK